MLLAFLKPSKSPLKKDRRGGSSGRGAIYFLSVCKQICLVDKHVQSVALAGSVRFHVRTRDSTLRFLHLVKVSPDDSNIIYIILKVSYAFFILNKYC